LAINENEILRTRIAEDGERFWQVVVALNRMEGTRQVVEEREIKELDLSAENKESVQRLNHDESKGRLSFFEILNDQVAGEMYFKWTAHHAVYDACVLSLIWAQVKNNYQILTMQNPPALQQQPRVSFAHFVRSTYNPDISSSSKTFWQTYLSASEPWPTFPAVSKVSNSISQTDSVLSQYFDFSINTVPGVTEASLIRAAWAWVQSLYLGTDDIIFGATLSGRSAPGASNAIGPTITTVPVRVTVSPRMQIKEFLERVQKEANAMMRHEHTYLSTIRGLSESAGWACDFGNILVVQDNRSQVGLINGGEYGTGTWDGVEAVSKDTDISHSIPLVLECVLEDAGLRIHAIFSSKFLDLGEVEFLLAHLSKAVEMLSEEALSQASWPEQRALGDIEFFSKMDEAFIKDWNQQQKPSANRLIHQVFSERAEQCGAKTAVDAWDIQFTYEELNHAGDIVAKKLIKDHEVGPGVLVAISFEKSGWTVLAMLSIWKAGGGFVPLDLSHPTSRLEDIIRSTQVKAALCSTPRVEQLKGLMAGAVLALNHESLREMKGSMDKMEANMGLSSSSLSHAATPQDICYVLFTSGSTGRPKGVVLEHASVSTSLLGHAEGLRIESSSRVLQFAAYTFDTSIGEIFSALLLGATLCVPSEQQRMSSLAEFINEKSVNWVWLTPTVASFLDPHAVPGVNTLLIGGEKATAKLFQVWIGRETSLLYGYGPTEASITTTLDVHVTKDTDPAKVGMPICASTWIVDPCENSRLLPIGCVGELVVSGPTVGRGYLNDELKTAAAFGEIPEMWESLVRPGVRKTSQRERLYRTGDLVRYDTTGNIVFVGRKDDQVKFHGQRIELSEITNRMDKILGDRCSSIVEKIEVRNPDPNGENAEDLLVAFFTLPGSEQGKDNRESQEDGKLDLFRCPSPTNTQVINDMETQLQALLPRYMIPSLFVPLKFIPVTTTGKVDRNRLKKELLQVINDSRRGDFMPERDRLKEQPRNGLEKQLQEIWCSILALPADRIGIRDSFFRLGGDSLKAIALVHAARRATLRVSVADIFLRPVLADMAEFVRDSRAVCTRDQGSEVAQALEERNQFSAFSILSSNYDINDIKSHASEQCGITMDDVEDIYPCTAMQVGMLVSSSMINHEEGDQKAGLYLLRRKIIFESRSAAMEFSAAWEIVRKRTPILRTRIFQYKSTIYQVVVKSDASSMPHPPDSAIDWYGRSLADLRMGPDGELEISLHHSIYDAVLLPRLLEDIRRQYIQLSSGPIIPPSQCPRRIPFRDFIEYLQSCDEKAASSFWRNYLAPTGGRVNKIAQSIFPSISQPSVDFEQQKTDTNEITRYFAGDKIENKTHLGITLANIINSAWAIVVARHTGAEEVIFGNTLSGRDVILETAHGGSDEGLVEGPTLTTVPLRFKVGADKPLMALLHEAQRDAAEVRRHQHFGMAKIAKVGNSKFRTLLVVQTPADIMDVLKAPSDAGESARKGLINEDIVSTALQNLPGIRGVSESQIAKQEYPLVLECLVNMTELTGVRAYYDERAIERPSILHLLSHFEQAIQTLVTESKQHQKASEVNLVTNTDLSTLRKWNAKPPERSQRTLLDLFLDRSKTNPDRHALHSTGITFSYEELDRYSSHAARYISERIIGFNQDAQMPFTIAICYEKSVWAVVSILAIMKLGAGYVPLDPSSPDSRLAMILDDIKASTIVCSPKQARRFSERAANSNIILFDSKIHEQTYTEDRENSYKAKSPTTPESIAYILYTSGSTGRPKGVLVPHSAICTSILAFSPTVKLSQNSRVLQFSSFGFDASVGEIFATLSVGGCICLPSDEERLGDVSKFMNESRVDWAFLTPVTLRIITLDDVPLLRVLVVGGEPLPPSLFKAWAARPESLQLMEAYGPTECCVFSTMNTSVTPETHPQDIGLPLGGAIWVVDPYDYHKLTPVECVGELVVSGNTIAAGYHNLPSTSASGFVEQTPKWASLFPEHAPMRRIYRTGDLVRFKADGSIHYVARKDNQVNLRGMRMELGEIEYHLARSAAGDKAAPIVVLTSIPNQREPKTEKSALVCFFVTELDGKIRPEPLRMTKQRKRTVQSIVSYLEGKVPPYMVPNIFIPLPCFPENASGKVERKALVEDILEEFDQDDFKHYTVNTTQAPNMKQPMTINEKTLQQIWSQLLGIDANIIKHDDSFFRLGGDSVGIIQMVTILRQKGLRLSPVEAMVDPKLSTVASKVNLIVRENVVEHCSKTTPFALLRCQPGTSRVERLVALAAKQCGVAREMIEDIYPCTALQEGLLSLSERIPGSYFNRQTFSLNADVNINGFIAAYRGLCKAHPILRTRIVRGDDGRSYQVVLHNDVKISFDSGDELEAPNIVLSEGSYTLSGKSLHSVAIRAPATTTESKCPTKVVRIIHHALYDAWSLPNLDTELEERYSAAESFVSAEIPSYTRFIDHISKNDSTAADEFWKQYLDGARQTCYPAVPQGYQPQTNASMKRAFELEWDKSSTNLQDRNTKATVARLAWAILLGKYSNDTDISFGVALSGRDALIEGIEEMTGPTNATIPVRYQLLTSNGHSPSIANVLELAHSQTTEMNKFQHHGLQNIMRTSPEAREVCSFGSLLVVQPAQRLQKWADSRSKILQEIPGEETSILLHPYPIVIELCFQNHSNSGEIYVHYDERILSSPQVDLILRQLYMTLQALTYSDPSARIDALDLNDRDSLGLMKRFHNETCKAPTERDIVSLVTDQRVLNPEAPAISAWDGKMTYGDLDTMSSSLSAYMRDTHGLKPESIVATCFEKSIWVIVAMLAIMKAGSAYVPIDPSAPDSYKRLLLDQVAAQGHANLFLVSEEQFKSIQHITPPGAQLLAITKSMVMDLPKPSYERNMALPSSAAYTLFTSGSTGVPKGVIMEHRSACTSILAHGSSCEFNPSTRTLQFAALTFDASIMEIWTTLAFGGCVCIPSESQRVNSLEQYITDANVNWAFLTPTVSGLICKERVETLRTLVLGGEALTLGTIRKWTTVNGSGRKAGRLTGTPQDLKLMNGYGPTECCVFTCVNTKITPATEPQDIGGAVGVSAWIVDPKDYNRLMPLTCPGELLIIGSTLAREYLGDPAKTKKAFVYPQWSRSILGAETRAYRTGDLASCGVDGRIRIIGRIDTQIKLNGMRIESGEIENALLSCASGTTSQIEVVVDKLALSTPGNEGRESPKIVAFMKFGSSSSTPLDIASFERELSSRMAAHVPAYMIPSQFIAVSQFPTTAAGKVDRKALRNLVQDPDNFRSIVIHTTSSLLNGTNTSREDHNDRRESASEIILRDLWAEVLQIENANLIKKQDNFFALGGESIRAIRLVALAREKHNMRLTVNGIFRHLLLADMAAQMTEIVEEVVEDQPFDLLLDDD
jgi:amino acid adenylation domain-containing protein